jgi:membrane-associated phospholipid phosphatase
MVSGRERVVPRSVHRSSRSAARIAPVLVAVLGPSLAMAQLHIEPHNRDFWIGSGVAIAGMAVIDERIRAFVASHQTEALDRLARPIGYVGMARYIVPALIGGAVVPRLVGDRALSTSVVHIGLGYAVADGLEALLKPVVGRHRPDETGQPVRFRPFRGGSSWHSFPSGHVAHVVSLATGISIDAHRPWATAAAYAIAAIVGLQRVYTQSHWASDVVAGSVLAIATSATTVRWLERSKATR